MDSFFTELAVAEQRIIVTGYDEDYTQYSGSTKETLEELIDYVESGNYTRAKSAKFIAAHFRMGTVELVEAWHRTYHKSKEESTIRGQVSVASQVLYDLFGHETFEELNADQPDRVKDILDALSIGDLMCYDIFIDGVSNYIKRPNNTQVFEFDELEEEMAFLAMFRRDDIEQAMSKLNSEKLFYIKQVLNKPLVVDYKVNEIKAQLLNELCRPSRY